MVTDIDVIATVIADGETESLAAATQPCIEQVFTAIAHNAPIVQLTQKPQLAQAIDGEIQPLLISFVGQLQDFGQRDLWNRLVIGKLIQQVSDREFHGGGVKSGLHDREMFRAAKGDGAVQRAQPDPVYESTWSSSALHRCCASAAAIR